MPTLFPMAPRAHIQGCEAPFGKRLLRDMNANGEGSGLDPVQREAVAWVVRLTSGEATVDDAERLKAWRARSAAHEQAFRLAGAAWKGTDGRVGTVRRRGMSRRLFLAGAGAGSALAAGWAGASLGVLPSLDSLMSDYATGVGEQRRISLTDGSAIELDGASALDAQFTPEARTVRMVSGAALIDVAPDARPFRTLAGPGEVTARDASFAVAVGTDETLVECTRGKLDIACRDATARLVAGERATLSEKGVSAPAPMDPGVAAPWRRGLLVFEDRPLAQVVEDINRHRRGRVVLARAGLGARRINGVFHLDRPDEIIGNLAASLRLAQFELPGGIVLLR